MIPVRVSDPGFAWLVGTPTFAPAGGTYFSAPTVTLRSETAGSTIHYTTTGADPTAADASVPTGGTVSVPVSLTLKAKAFKTGVPASNVSAAVYALKLPPPTLTPAGGTHSTPQAVTVSSPVAGAALHYTTNGIVPTTSDPEVASGGTITVDASLTLYVKASRLGGPPAIPRWPASP